MNLHCSLAEFRQRVLPAAAAVVVLGATAALCAPQRASAAEDADRRTPVVIAVENSTNAVVNISTREQVYERGNPFSTFGNDPFFNQFFRDFFDSPARRKSVRTHLGSGVIIDSRGYVVTNWHVIDKATEILVTTADDREYRADLIGADRTSDLSVLKIDTDRTFTTVPSGDSDHLFIGETVIAIGNPFGLSHTVTTGVVSAVNRSVKANEQVYENFIQTDASINPGNSGGPLLNIRGELIGINTAIYGQAEGIGFAIPINTAMRIVNDLLLYGEVQPPWIGLRVQDVKPDVAAHLDYPEQYGVIVTDIFPGSPARRAGVQTGDIIMMLGDKRIKSKSAYKRLLSLYTAGTTVPLTVFRSGSQRNIPVRAARFPEKYISVLCWDDFGLKLTGNSRALARRYGLHTAAGVVITEIRPGGQAERIGLRPGDIILKMHERPISGLDDFEKRLVQNIHRDSLLLLVQRGRYGYYVTLDL